MGVLRSIEEEENDQRQGESHAGSCVQKGTRKGPLSEVPITTPSSVVFRGITSPANWNFKS